RSSPTRSRRRTRAPSNRRTGPSGARSRAGRPRRDREAGRRRRLPLGAPGLRLGTPSLVALGVVVDGALGCHIRLSRTSWRGAANPNPNDNVGLRNYRELMDNERFASIDIRNIVIFTVVFVVGALVVGFFMALLLDKGVRGENFFRSVYLFPMAISFIATAII